MQLRSDNGELINVVKRKDDELRQVREFYSELDRKRKKNS